MLCLSDWTFKVCISIYVIEIVVTLCGLNFIVDEISPMLVHEDAITVISYQNGGYYQKWNAIHLELNLGTWLKLIKEKYYSP